MRVFAGERNVVAFRINMHNLNDATSSMRASERASEGTRKKRSRRIVEVSGEEEGERVSERSPGEEKRRERRREERHSLRRDSRNSYSCLTTTRHSIMQQLARTCACERVSRRV